MNKNIKLLAIIVLALGLFSCQNKTANKTTTESERVEIVETSSIQKEKIHRVLDFSSTLQGYEHMNIAPSLTGNIEKILVDVGSRVSKGQLLLRMNQNQYNTAKISLASTKVEYDRIASLKASGSASQQAFDQIKAQYEQLEENTRFLQENTFVKAQFSGVISAKNYEDGEMYAGSPILTLTQINTLKALINIPEIYFPKIKQGMELEIFSEIYPDQVFKGIIEIVYPTIDPNTHTFQVKIKIPNAKEVLRPGMYITSKLALGEVEAIIVPYSAVLKLVGSNERYVFVNNNCRAKRITVQLGQRFDEMVEISGEGIEEGVELITVGQARLIDNVKLNVVKKK